MSEAVKEIKSVKKEKEKKLGRLGKDTWVDYTIMTLLVLFAIITFYPMWYVVAGSFSNGNDYLKGGVYFWPRVFTTANYTIVFTNEAVWRALVVTVFRCLTGPFLLVLMTSIVAYGMSRRELHFKKQINTYFMITMFFSGGTVPYFMLCKAIGLLDTFWMYIIPGMFNVYDMILVRSFFKGSPEELHEAAVIDGAGEFRIFFTIMLPLAMPILMTILMWGLIGHWNDYLTSQYYMTGRPDLHTLQSVLYDIILQGNSVNTDVPSVVQDETTGETINFAAMIFGVLPILVAYPFLQKYFTKGLYVGSLKG